MSTPIFGVARRPRPCDTWPRPFPSSAGRWWFAPKSRIARQAALAWRSLRALRARPARGRTAALPNDGMVSTLTTACPDVHGPTTPRALDPRALQPAMSPAAGQAPPTGATAVLIQMVAVHRARSLAEPRSVGTTACVGMSQPRSTLLENGCRTSGVRRAHVSEPLLMPIVERSVGNCRSSDDPMVRAMIRAEDCAAAGPCICAPGPARPDLSLPQPPPCKGTPFRRARPCARRTHSGRDVVKRPRASPPSASERHRRLM